MTPQLKETHPHQKSLTASWREGIPAAIMLAIIDNYLTPLGLFLGATAQTIGFLVAIPNLLGSISQLFAARLVKLLGSRLYFLIRSAFLQVLLLFLIAIFPLIHFPKQIIFFIALVACFRVSTNLISTVWGSLVSDYLKPEERGSYFGGRAQAAGIAGLIGMTFAGILLTYFKKISPAGGFAILFAMTALSRITSGFLMMQMEDIPLQHKQGVDFTFFKFLRQFRSSNFVKFVLYVAALTFSTNLAAPYFSVYMLKELHFSYFAYTLLYIGPALAGLLSFSMWGRHADIVGNAKIIKMTSLMVPLLPLLWLASRNIVYLTIVEMFSGFIWGGFNLCAANFIYDAVSPEKRVRCLGYFNLINGVCVFLGASIGGYLAEHLPPVVLASRICTLFLISGIFRFISHFLLSGRFQEVRKTAKEVHSRDLFFSVVGIKPIFEKK